MVDVQSAAVWASTSPVAVDGDSWTLALWQVQEQGVHCITLRGLHQGQSPLTCSGMTSVTNDWLEALGYPPPAVSLPHPHHEVGKTNRQVSQLSCCSRKFSARKRYS